MGAEGRASRVGEVLHEPEGFLTRLGGEGEGELWKGPMRASTWAREKGPMWRPRIRSFVMMAANSAGWASRAGLLAGANVEVMVWMPASNPWRMESGRLGYLLEIPAWERRRRQASAL